MALLNGSAAQLVPDIVLSDTVRLESSRGASPPAPPTPSTPVVHLLARPKQPQEQAASADSLSSPSPSYPNSATPHNVPSASLLPRPLSAPSTMATGPQPPPEVDPSIVEALKSSKDRLYVLKLGETMEDLIRSRTIGSRVDLRPASSYQRLLVHRCAGYYNLVQEPSPTTIAIIVTAESRIPSKRICDLVPAEETALPAFQIMRRSDKSAKASNASSSSPSIDGNVSDDTGDANRSTGSGGRKKHMTIEEREAAYNEARSRIFEGFVEPEGSTTGTMSSRSIDGDIDAASTAPTESDAGASPSVSRKDSGQERWNGTARRTNGGVITGNSGHASSPVPHQRGVGGGGPYSMGNTPSHQPLSLPPNVYPPGLFDPNATQSMNGNIPGAPPAPFPPYGYGPPQPGPGMYPGYWPYYPNYYPPGPSSMPQTSPPQVPQEGSPPGPQYAVYGTAPGPAYMWGPPQQPHVSLPSQQQLPQHPPPPGHMHVPPFPGPHQRPGPPPPGTPQQQHSQPPLSRSSSQSSEFFPSVPGNAAPVPAQYPYFQQPPAQYPHPPPQSGQRGGWAPPPQSSQPHLPQQNLMNQNKRNSGGGGPPSHPPARNPWGAYSFGPGIAVGGMPVPNQLGMGVNTNSNSSSSSLNSPSISAATVMAGGVRTPEGLGIRVMPPITHVGGIPLGGSGYSSGSSSAGSMRAGRRERTSSASTNASGVGKDETSSIASSSSTSSKRTYTSTTSSQQHHPLPDRPDWVLQMRQTSANNRDRAPPSLAHRQQQQRQERNGSGGPSTLLSNDFPPLGGGSRTPPALSGVWGAGKSGGTVNGTPGNRLDDHDQSFTRPPPKGSGELFNPNKGDPRRVKTATGSAASSPVTTDPSEKGRDSGNSDQASRSASSTGDASPVQEVTQGLAGLSVAS